MNHPLTRLAATIVVTLAASALPAAAGTVSIAWDPVADTDLAAEEARLVAWLALGRHGAMDYMARHGSARARPAALVPGTVSVITARDQLPAAHAALV